MSLSYYQLNAKIKRAMKQRIFLLNAKYNNEEWKFHVQGTTGNIYTLKMCKGNQTCSCPDFIQRGSICKHIIFIVCRVAQCTENLRKLKNNDVFESIPDLNAKLVNRLSRRIKEKTINQENNYTDDCIICFEELGLVPDKNKCKVCKIVYHTKCLNRWLTVNKSCAQCRTKWENEETNDPLESFDVFLKN